MIGGDILGEGSLDGAGAQGKADSEYRMDHVIDAEAFRTDSPGHENPVEKAEDPAQKAGSGKKEGTG